MIRRMIVALLLTTACLGQEPNVARMEQIVQSYVTTGKFMGTVLVAHDGKALFEKAYGSANLEWAVANTPATRFRIGSVTKQFTAACILLLEERGKLNTGDPVKKYLPDAPAAWDKVTIFHLLTHTSGIPSFTEFPDYGSTRTLPSPTEKTVARFRDKPLDFQPGEKFHYDNSGYVLLAYLIEKISGEAYDKFLQENILTPLGLKDTGYDSFAQITERRASGYMPRPGGRVNADYIDMTIPSGAGGLYSTTGDLVRWEQALFGGKVVSAESLRKMTTPFLNHYAFGLGVDTVAGHPVISHGGGIEGFNSQLSYFPEDKLEVAVLANLNGPAAGEIAGRLAAVVHGEKVVLPGEHKEVAVAPATLARYAGTYELTPAFSIVMTVENGQLMTQATGQQKLPLFAESDTRFFLKVVDAAVEFFQDGNGKVTHLILYQGGRETKGVRK